MKFQKSSLIILVLISILLVSFSAAQAEQPSPAHFYGQVKVNGENVPDGTEVSAWIDGVLYALTETTTDNGHSVYALDVPGDDASTPGVIEGGVEGDTVIFKLGDLELEAEQTGTWASGDDINLDLSVMVITVTADPQTKVYGEPDPELTYIVDLEDQEIILTGTLDREAGEHVGEYAITQGNLSAEGYTIVFIPDDLTITPKPITITADPQTKIYGTVDPPLSYTLSTPLVVGDTMDGGLARISGEFVGQYEILKGTLKIVDGNQGANYAITYQDALLTIEPRPITVTADDKEKVYGQVDPPLTYQITSGILVPPDTIFGALARVGGEAVGSYQILRGFLAISDGNNGDNYELNFKEGTLTINPITITSVVVSDIQPPIAGESPDITATVSSVPNGGISGSTTEVTWDPDDDPFELATLYTARVTLTTAEGHAFSGSISATLNGEEANVLLNPDGTLTVSYGFKTAGYNTAPIADNQTVFTLKDTPIEIILTGSDPEGDPLTFEIIDQEMLEGLSGTPPNMLYSPPADFIGMVSFMFAVSDGQLTSNPAEVIIHVYETACLQVSPAALMQTQQADTITQLTLTLTNTCSVELAFNFLESVIEAPLLSEGFENNLMPPLGWETRQLNKTYTWESVTNRVDQGQYAARVRYDTVNPSDEWLITPVLDTSEVLNLVLSFRADSDTNFPGASMKVWVLDEDGEPLTAEPLWDHIRDEHWTDPIYRSVLVDLGQFDGYGEIRIGWQYIGQDGQNFYLDTVYVGSRADIPWLSLPITSGNIATGESKDISITFDTTGVDLGTYQGLLSTFNSPNPPIHIPVRLRVIGELQHYYLPLIFR